MYLADARASHNRKKNAQKATDVVEIRNDKFSVATACFYCIN